ncbi:hypothetical protein BH24ACT4_BH24ACT4_07510 [soil metagenome]
MRGEAKGSTYDDRWRQLAARGESVHGEADLVSALVAEDPGSDPATAILDGGCGTGRVAIELARRGHRTVGVDRDGDLLAAARAKAPELTWAEADLSDLDDHVAPGSIDLAVLAGNVLIFVDPGTEAAVIEAVAQTLGPGGRLVAGFQVRPRGYDPENLDRDASRAGLQLSARWSTWDRDPWDPGGDYQVSVHLRPEGSAPGLV